MRIPLITIILAYLLSIGADLYIYFDVRHFCHRKKSPAVAYAVFAVLCWALLTVLFVLPKRDADRDILPIMWILYTYLTVFIPKLIYVIASLIGRITQIFKKKRLNTGLWVGLPLALLAFVVMWWGALVGRREIEVKNLQMLSPRIPEAFNGYKIAQISDLHVGTWGNDTTFISEFVDAVNATKPNLIVFTGDIVNRNTAELHPFLKVLSRLKAPDGVISVLGNHDYGDYVDWKSPELKAANMQQMRDYQKQMGWILLDNRRIPLVAGSDTLMLIGVGNWGEPPFHQYGNLSKAYPQSPDSAYNLNDDRFKILLTHNPEHWRREVSKTSNVDLTLSGHTHAMQFILSIGGWRWSPSEYRYELWGGLYESLAPSGLPMRIYVNIGSGEVGLPYRIGADPEITVFTLRHRNK